MKQQANPVEGKGDVAHVAMGGQSRPDVVLVRPNLESTADHRWTGQAHPWGGRGCKATSTVVVEAHPPCRADEAASNSLRASRAAAGGVC